ncbi:sigma factor-like helix-turn-helix DNA-binding protein [Plantactinospora sp. WMMB334]|uniref:sigma factor-like helix-turn-helix DNA-binding protein n=1 Tax=Plantactinospora sp. WMMB334 TaxID=3404119 RepID=UPI003B952B64
MTESVPEDVTDALREEFVLDGLLPWALVRAEAALRKPHRDAAELGLLRTAMIALTTLDGKRNPGGVHRLAMLLTRLDLHAEAERLLDWTAWRTTRGSDTWLAGENVRAILAAARGDRDRAALLLDLALRTTDRLSVTSAKLHANLAVLCLEAGEFDRAARHATVALTAGITADRPEEWPPDLLASAESSAMLAIERSATDPPRTAEELRDLAETQFALAMRRGRLDLVESAIEVMELASQHLTARLPAGHPEAVRLRAGLATAEERYAGMRATNATPAAVNSTATPAAVSATAVSSGARPAGASGCPGGATAPAPADAGGHPVIPPVRVALPAAYHLVVDRYLDTVFRFVYYRVGDRRLAEKLTSTAVRDVLHGLDAPAGRAPGRAAGRTAGSAGGRPGRRRPPADRDLGLWLIGAARGVLADQAAGHRPVASARPPDRPSRDTGTELVHDPVLVALRRLDPVQQDHLVLSSLLCLSVAEIAQVMGKSEGRVRAARRRALRALTRLLPRAPWRTRVRLRLTLLRQMLHEAFRPGPSRLRGDEDENPRPAERPDRPDATGQLMVLGLSLRAVPSHALLGPDSDARLRSMLLAIAGGAVAAMPRAGDAGTGTAPGTPTGGGQPGLRIVVPGRPVIGRLADAGGRRRWRRRRARNRDTAAALPVDANILTDVSVSGAECVPWRHEAAR